ncbi:MAG: hypothetical protein VB087_11240 [Candidatus Limiplasma sp.]|nr:hypothetical protein [Candidatus Limiplasma sp.]MEA5145714.1 hypothetical protein [Candidatus Limiplasma sp.]
MNHGILHRAAPRPEMMVQAHKTTSPLAWLAIGAVAIAMAAMVVFLSTHCL